MKGGTEQTTKKPPVTTHLAQLLKNPDLLSMNLSYQSTREAFLDIAYQLDDFQKTMSLFEEAESRYMKMSDMQLLTKKIQKLNTQMDQNSDDLSTEIRELRQYFSFQIKELNSKVDQNLTNVINELTKPIAAAPAPANNGEGSSLDDSFYKSLKSEIENLKERFESLMTAISKPMSSGLDGEEEEEDLAEKENKNIEEGDENQAQAQSSKSSARPVTPSSEKGDIPSTPPKTTNETNNSESTTTNNANLDLNADQLNNSGTINTKEVNESISTPSLVTTKQIGKVTSINFKKVMEIRLQDIKIQLDKLNVQITQNEEKLNPLIPVVQQNSTENTMFRPELMKLKADVLLLKGDVDIIKDSQANSVVDVMKMINEQISKNQGPQIVDIEKPLTAMRHQIMQQFAKMENAFNEQLKKVKAEISSIKTLMANVDLKGLPQETGSQNQSLINDDDQIKVADSFANEEPAEKALLEQMQKEAEAERLKKQEELERITKEAQEAAALATSRSKEEREKEAEKIKKDEEEKFLAQSNQLANSNENETTTEKVETDDKSSSNLKQAEVETDNDESSKLRYDTYTEVKNLPNQLVVSVLVDSPPSLKKVVKEDFTDEFFTDEKQSSNNDLALRSTLAFEYARIGNEEQDLVNVKRDIKSHQEIIERIVSQIAEMGQTKIEVPSLSTTPSQEKEDFYSQNDIQALKDTSADHQRSIDELNIKVNQLVTLNNFANLSDDEKKDQKVIQELLERQAQLIQNSNSNQRQITLTPVHFTPLNFEPLKVYKAKSSKDKPSAKSKQSKGEAAKSKNPKRTKKPPPPPSKEAPAPALSSKTKIEPSSSIEVPPNSSISESKSSQKINNDKKNEKKELTKTSSSTSQDDQKKEENEKEIGKSTESNNEKPKDNEMKQENENQDEVKDDNDNEDDNENNNDIEDDETQDIIPNEEEIKKKHHRSSSRHSSSHHSPSHHSSRRGSSHSSPKQKDKTNDEGENEQKPIQPAENANETAEDNTNKEPEKEVQNQEESEKDKNKENVEEEDNNEEEEEGRPISRNSTEFFSPADSSVGSSVVYEAPAQSDEFEEEEEESMDPVLKEKLDQMTELLTSHQEQIKNIREGLVEIRSTVQLVKSEIKDQRSTLLLPQLDGKSESSFDLTGSKTTFDSNNNTHQQIGDDNAIRAVRRRFDMQTREFENELYEIRKEIMQLRVEQSKMPQTVTERIIQVPANGFPQNNNQANNNVTSPSQESNNNDEESSRKKKKKKENIFNDENKLLEIKSFSIPNKSNTPNKVPKLPIIDPQPQNIEQFTPSNYKDQQPLIVQSQSYRQPSTQPTTPKLKKLPPIIPSNQSTSKDKESNTKEEEETNDQQVSDDNQKSLSARTTNPEHRPFFNNVVQQSINELNIMNANEDVDEHILNLIIEVRSQLMLLIDKNTSRLNEVERKIDKYVDKEFVQNFFQKIRSVINEINSNVTTMKQSLPERVTKDELQDIIEELYHNLTSDQETSGGTTSYRCLLCGRPKTSISGMIRDIKVAETLGQPTQTTITQTPNTGSRGTLIYGPDKQLYRGKGNFGRPTIAVSDTKKQLPKMK